VLPVFGDLFLDEPIPVKGYLDVSQLDKPGFGLTLNPAARLIPAQYLLTPNPERPIGQPALENIQNKKPEERDGLVNGVIHGIKDLTTS
jgi:L-rhamnonate dehydratase